MRILLVHNHYGSAAPSGENVAFALERDLLVGRGHEVRVIERFSDDLRGAGAPALLAAALRVPWNRAAARAVSAAIRDFRPDILHAHNTFPLLSPAIFPAARGVVRVLTLHNYRLFCAAGTLLRAGRVCTDCLDRGSALPSLVHGCYRGSRPATLPLAAAIGFHRRRGTWLRDVEAFIALTDFQRGRMIAAGLPGDRVWVKPNFYPGNPTARPITDRAERAVFVGRLGPEKGVTDLVEAWLGWGPAAPELRIVGDGPLRPALEAATAAAGNIRLLGSLPREVAEAEIAEARLLVLPSRWFEGLPMVLREALAFGTPILASAIGALPDLVGAAGATFPPGDVGALRKRTAALLSDAGGLARMSAAARQAFAAHYGEAANYRQLLAIYAAASGGLPPGATRHEARGGSGFRPAAAVGAA
jgi:glycosyltransferase involved in cell wall biosynthesis